MSKPKIAIVSFPGNNCEVESIRAIKNADMEPIFFRWNDDIAKLADIDGYFIPGGFSYEDRGRAGMVAARDPLLTHIKAEAGRGKVVIGNCNGAQILIESGLIPHADELEMSLAHNVSDGEATGFINEWVWITPSCAQDRCCTSNWEGAMHMPIAHGEGRFTTKDPSLMEKLQSNNQIAFQYCDELGFVSEDSSVTPNGSTLAIAGICNPEGNVVALMPHPERTPLGDAYFKSVKNWIESHPATKESGVVKNNNSQSITLPERKAEGEELFIDTVIVNNEERTVEQAAKALVSDITVKQLRYIKLSGASLDSVLGKISIFNPIKETAYIRRGSVFTKWNADTKTEDEHGSVLDGIAILRRDDPDTGAAEIGKGTQTGICYVCTGATNDEVQKTDVMSIFGNPHASTLELLV